MKISDDEMTAKLDDGAGYEFVESEDGECCMKCDIHRDDPLPCSPNSRKDHKNGYWREVTK